MTNTAAAVSQIKPVYRQVLGVQEQPAVRLPGRDQGPPEGSHLDHGDDRAAPLGHAVGFGGDDRKPQGRGGLRQEPGQGEGPLPSQAADDDLLFHGRPSLAAVMAPSGQTWTHTPQPTQRPPSMTTRPSVSSMDKAGHSKSSRQVRQPVQSSVTRIL